MSKHARLGAYWVGWWLAALVLWLLLTSTVAANEVVTGLGAAAVAATTATVVHAQEQFDTRFRWGWLRFVAVLPVRIATDTWLLTRALAAHLAGAEPRGRFEEVRLPGTSLAPERRAMETLSTIVVGMSPNWFVVGFDEERGVALLHELMARPRSPETLEEVMLGP
ncbi:MAG TPA: hypothetical protein VKJ83_07220 [Actinomycetota bacterium]|nr:hypothetical protein [Actinomycetota bacterium]